MADALSLTPEPPPRPRRGPLLALLVAMRPKQWTKNLLLFAGLLFTLDRPHSAADFQRAALGFLLFCALSSVVYLVNDLADRESDRLHPKKRRRPIAAGELSPQAALVAAVALGVCGTILSFLLGLRFGLVALTYLLLTFAYSFRLKHVVIVDVLALAAGFVLRAIAGAVVIHVSISPWLILCTLMLALFLGLSKRRAELVAVRQAGTTGTRRILEHYTPEMLDQMIVIVTSALPDVLRALRRRLARRGPPPVPDGDHPVRHLRHLPLPVPDAPALARRVARRRAAGGPPDAGQRPALGPDHGPDHHPRLPETAGLGAAVRPSPRGVSPGRARG